MIDIPDSNWKYDDLISGDSIRRLWHPALAFVPRGVAETAAAFGDGTLDVAGNGIAP
jgi:hypothetical protein